MAIIGLDIDGVLASFEHGFAPLVTAASGIEFPDVGNPDWPAEWDWDRAAGVTSKQTSIAWEGVKNNPTFWRHLPAKVGAFEFLRWLSTCCIGDDIYFITHRMGQRVKWQTETWLQSHGFIYPPTVIISGEKGVICKALGVNFYIEDKPSNILDVLEKSPKTRLYIQERPYNKAIEGCPRGDLEGFKQFIHSNYRRF